MLTPAPDERGLTFSCEGETLVGVVHRASGRLGVLVVTGGPQYRAGSHRQFTLLARRLAAAGVPVMRFDCRGHGDSGGARPGFEHLAADVDAALGAFRDAVPDLDAVVLLGLCDAASAVLLHPRLPAVVRGLVLINPWVTEAGIAPATMLRHYYLRRLLAPDFWRALAGGRVGVTASLRELMRTAARALGRQSPSRQPADRGTAAAASEQGTASLAQRMAAGLERFSGPVLLVTSGRDLVASEFLDRARSEPRWRRLLSRADLRHEHRVDANHTFSSAHLRGAIEDLVLEWLGQW